MLQIYPINKTESPPSWNSHSTRALSRCVYSWPVSIGSTANSSSKLCIWDHVQSWSTKEKLRKSTNFFNTTPSQWACQVLLKQTLIKVTESWIKNALQAILSNIPSKCCRIILNSHSSISLVHSTSLRLIHFKPGQLPRIRTNTNGR